MVLQQMGLLAPHGQQCDRTHAAINKGTIAITNRIAIILGVMIFGFFIADGINYDWQMSLFLGRKFAALTEYIKFWR